jgi:hypothetical protein
MIHYKGNSRHKDSLQVGQEFQDFIVEQCITQLGVSISLFLSKKYQYQKGESLQGVEIKYDARSTGDSTYGECRATGNVAIEIAEKGNAGNLLWVPSGIYRRDNSWLYIIGNYHQAWVFGKNTLQLLHKSGKLPERATLPTIKNMMLTISEADKYCEKKLVF